MALLWGPKRIKAAEAEIEHFRMVIEEYRLAYVQDSQTMAKFERRVKTLLRKIEVLEDDGRIQAVKRDHAREVDQMAWVIRDQDRRIRIKNQAILEMAAKLEGGSDVQG